MVKGSHLVLELGYDATKREFYLHNPSGISKHTQENATVAFDDFKKFLVAGGSSFRVARLPHHPDQVN